MGPSGAGKSTLLYALMGTARYGAARGRLWVNGREMRLARLRRILGYVPQARCPLDTPCLSWQPAIQGPVG